MQDEALAELLAVAREVAWAGGRRTLAYYNNSVSVEEKSDGSPVTVADREAEQVMRRLIGQRYPDHGVLGEEFGETKGSADVRWILDPIDGTKTFVRGVPLYGTLVGVEVAGEPTVGVVYMPALDEMVSAARGMGCSWNGRAARVSQRTGLDAALVAVTDEKMARQRNRGRGEGAYQRLVDATKLQRTWADCYAYVLVATGRAEVALDPAMNAWDCAALMPIIEEAGGRFTAWSGERTIYGGDAVATNGALHEEVLGLLAD